MPRWFKSVSVLVVLLQDLDLDVVQAISGLVYKIVMFHLNVPLGSLVEF
jgi:hypothetical protein